MLYKEVAKQENLKTILTNAFLSKKIPHAWIFMGEEGSENLKMAYSYAKTLLCDNPKDQYCGTCNSCNLFNAKNHPDLLKITPRGKIRQIKKDDIDDLIQFLSLKSYRGGYKVIIVEESERLPEMCANVLLKSLEEPPPKTVFILVCNKENSLLPTIVSRCQQIDFMRLSDEYIESELKNEKDLPLSPHILAKLSRGHLEKIKGEKLSQLIIKRDIVFSMISKWTNEGTRAIIEGVENIMAFYEENKIHLEKEISKCIKELKNADTNYKEKKEEELNSDMVGILKDILDDILDIFSTFFRDIMIIQQGLGKNHLFNIDYEKLIIDSSQRIFDIEDKIINIDRARDRLQGNVNQKLTLEALFLKLFP